MGLRKPACGLVLWVLLWSLGIPLGIANDDKVTIVAGLSEESLYDTSITDAKIVFSLIFNQAIKESEEQFVLEIYKTDLEVERKLIAGELDAVFTNTIHYLEIEEYLNPKGSYIIQHGPKIKPQYYLLTARKSGIDRLSQLQGMKLSIPRGHAVGELFLDVMLLRQNLPVTDQFFSEIRETRESNSAVVNLFFGKVDATLITDYAFNVASELNPQLTKQLIVIDVSEPLAHQVVSVRHDFPPERIKNIEPYILNVHESPKMSQVLKTFRLTAVRKIKSNTLAEVRELSDEHRSLLVK
ncbi:MAG: phosphate/phosphite/phosphonate ABC transporter substrate-binding protein [Candidatus Thiodiazotropha lotti]|nr:phosphate/phosphite/phosphonate ABC transporter substrate-binding protein [Candidatus Thiodiazotropha lotti]MCW4186932.1 phosphate/phosphite/phosphonate ABC transporter substrate-binding protein [Candidatus Thiodiazotropha lotti]